MLRNYAMRSSLAAVLPYFTLLRLCGARVEYQIERSDREREPLILLFASKYVCAPEPDTLLKSLRIGLLKTHSVPSS